VIHLIETSIAIPLRDGDSTVTRAVAGLDGAILLSVITRVELEGGVYRDPALAARRRARLDVLLAAIPTVEFDAAAADAYGRIVAIAGYSRRKVVDRMIAASAIVQRARLVTKNPQDFADISGLALTAW
jgi:predicted nucleic acid-binding protein